MFLLNDICEIPDILKIIYFVKELLKIGCYLVPIMLILMISIDFTKAVISNIEEDMKKKVSIAIKRIISAICVFLVPIITNFTMNMLGNLSYNMTKCYNNANLSSISSFEMIEKEDTTIYPPIIVNFPNNNNISVKPNSSDNSNNNNSNSNNNSSNSNSNNNSSNSNSNNNSSNSNSNNSNNTTNSSEGMGTPKKIKIEYNVPDKEGRCGKHDNCASIATVTYPKKTVKYYMGKQSASGLNSSASCRVNAFMCATNAVANGKNSALDLVHYLESVNKFNYLIADGIEKALSHYGAKAKVYHEDLSKNDAEKVIETALNNGQPVMVFVANKYCSDLAGSHHALLLLGYDDNGKIVFQDSCNRYPNSKKRTTKEMAQCLSPNSIAKKYYRVIVFSF